jgi:hypothetical protein
MYALATQPGFGRISRQVLQGSGAANANLPTRIIESERIDAMTPPVMERVRRMHAIGMPHRVMSVTMGKTSIIKYRKPAKWPCTSGLKLRPISTAATYITSFITPPKSKIDPSAAARMSECGSVQRCHGRFGLHVALRRGRTVPHTLHTLPEWSFLEWHAGHNFCISSPQTYSLAVFTGSTLPRFTTKLQAASVTAIAVTPRKRRSQHHDKIVQRTPLY